MTGKKNKMKCKKYNVTGMDGWMDGRAGLRIAYSNTGEKQCHARKQYGTGWMDGWMVEPG